MQSMTDEQEAHLTRIKNTFARMVDVKYRKGQREHGGDLFDKTAVELVDMAIDEAIDQVTYLVSLRDRLTVDGY